MPNENAASALEMVEGLEAKVSQMLEERQQAVLDLMDSRFNKMMMEFKSPLDQLDITNQHYLEIIELLQQRQESSPKLGFGYAKGYSSPYKATSRKPARQATKTPGAKIPTPRGKALTPRGRAITTVTKAPPPPRYMVATITSGNKGAKKKPAPKKKLLKSPRRSASVPIADSFAELTVAVREHSGADTEASDHSEM